MEYGMWSMECGVRNMEYRVYGVWNVEYRVRNVEYGTWSMERGVWSMEETSQNHEGQGSCNNIMLVLGKISLRLPWTENSPINTQPPDIYIGQCSSHQITTHMHVCLECRVSWVRVPPEAAHFSWKSDCFGCAVLLCFVCLLTLLASFFLISH